MFSTFITTPETAPFLKECVFKMIKANVLPATSYCELVREDSLHYYQIINGVKGNLVYFETEEQARIAVEEFLKKDYIDHDISQEEVDKWMLEG